MAALPCCGLVCSDDPALLAANRITGGQAAIFYRFNNIGPRDNDVTDFTGSMNLGFDGVLPTEAVGDVEWNAGYMYSKTDNTSDGSGYILKSAARNAIKDGKFTNGEFDKSVNDLLSYDTSRTSKMDFFQWYGGLGWEMGELPAGPIGWYWGSSITTGLTPIPMTVSLKQATS